MDKVCILLATYNGEKFLKEQIDSILNQTYSNFCLLISDDSSNDSTVKIISEYTQNYPNKVILLGNEKKGGATENFAFLLKNAIKAKYYMFSDQDDVWNEDKIEKSLNRLKEMQRKGNKNCLVYSDAFLVDEKLHTLAESFLDNSKLKKNKDNRANILVSSFAPGAAMIFDDDLYDLVCNMPKEAHIHDWWVLLHAVYLGNVGLVNEQLYKYRQHGKNVYGAGLIRSKKGIMEYFRNNSLFSTISRLNKQTHNLQLKQKRMVEKFRVEKKLLITNENKEILDDYLQLFSNIGKVKKIKLIKKNKFYSISLIDNILFIWNIVKRKV